MATPSSPPPPPEKKSSSSSFAAFKSWFFRFLAAGTAFGAVYYRTGDTTDASIVASCVFLTVLFLL